MTWNHTHSFKNLDKYFIGFDRFFDKVVALQEQTENAFSKFPPYNIRKIDDNKFVIEMAVAGMTKQDITVELLDNRLRIVGNSASSEDDAATNYLYRGIANRAFTREFTLADQIEIQNAELLNGMLRIWLESITPEANKPKQIPISEPQTETVKK